jgi:uncharacterized RDD family membrane protein YckC
MSLPPPHLPPSDGQRAWGGVTDAPPPGYLPYEVRPQMSLAPWGRRVIGHVVNFIVYFVFSLPGLVVFFLMLDPFCASGECKPVGDGALFALIGSALIGVTAFAIIYGRMISRTGQAWGHRVAGVRIVDSSTGDNIGIGRAIARFIIGYWLNGFCYLGYLWPLWDANNQTFADKVFSTYSVCAPKRAR